MSKFFNRNEEVIRAYLNGQEEGRNGNKSLFFRHGVLYSYGEHFPLAVKCNGKYIVNGDRYSVTTSKHQGTFFQLVPQRRRVEIPFTALENIGPPTTIIKMDFEILDRTDEGWHPTGRYDKYGNEIREHRLGECLFRSNGTLYLSGFDPSGSNDGLYFLTQLAPQNRVIKTVNDAYENMKPEAVKQAEQEGKDVRRQGEFFFVNTGYEYNESHNLPAASHFFFFRPYSLAHHDPDREQRRHHATVGFYADGRQFVCGVVRHTNNDHRMLKLYDEPGTPEKDRYWYEVFEADNQVISYSAIGGID